VFPCGPASIAEICIARSVFFPCSLLNSIELTLFVIQRIRLPFGDVILSRVRFYCQGQMQKKAISNWQLAIGQPQKRRPLLPRRTQRKPFSRELARMYANQAREISNFKFKIFKFKIYRAPLHSCRSTHDAIPTAKWTTSACSKFPNAPIGALAAALCFSLTFG
jgi:hypothetical protein